MTNQSLHTFVSCLPRVSHFQEKKEFIAKKILFYMNWTQSTPAILKNFADYGLEAFSQEAKLILLDVAKKIISFVEVSNFDLISKDIWSRYLAFLKEVYPQYSFADYFFNYGPTPPLPPIDSPMAHDPVAMKKITESKFGTTLDEKGVELMLEHGAEFYLNSAELNSMHYKFQFSAFPLHKVVKNLQSALAEYIPKLEEYRPICMVTQSTSSLHINIVCCAKRMGILEFVVLDSVGGTFPPLPRADGAIDGTLLCQTVENILTFCQSQAITTFKIYTFPTKRQQDLLSCPLFVVRDYFALRRFSLWNYFYTLEMSSPELIQRCYVPSLPESIQIYSVLEHPHLLVMSQSVSFLTNFFRTHANHIRRFSCLETFEKNVRTGCVEISTPDGKRTLNLRAQKDFQKIAYRIIRHKFFNASIVRRNFTVPQIGCLLDN